MRKWVFIAALIVGALICCGIVSAGSPARETIYQTKFVHYQDDAGDTVKEKAVPAGPDVNLARTKAPKPTVTPTPGVTSIPTPTVSPAPAQSDLYKLKSSRWTQYPVKYTVNTDGSGLGADSVAREVVAAFGTWDGTVELNLSIYGGAATVQGIFGNGRNEVYWAPITDTRVIAVTAVSWTSTGVIESDIQMNSLLPWGIDADGEGGLYGLTGRFDIRNIATHETGHFFGLADLYDTSAADLTMYGYSATGQVKKVSLGHGDILGIHALYGA